MHYRREDIIGKQEDIINGMIQKEGILEGRDDVEIRTL